jgi:hypothetical protein
MLITAAEIERNPWSARQGLPHAVTVTVTPAFTVNVPMFVYVPPVVQDEEIVKLAPPLSPGGSNPPQASSDGGSGADRAAGSSTTTGAGGSEREGAAPYSSSPASIAETGSETASATSAASSRTARTRRASCIRVGIESPQGEKTGEPAVPVDLTRKPSLP